MCGTTTGVEVQQPVHSGWLYKWASYLKGYQKRWFVLQNGTLAYYRSDINSHFVYFHLYISTHESHVLTCFLN